MTTRSRHIPLRSCIICGDKRSKRELTRIVATPSEGVIIDPSAKMQGRGTYVCKDGECASQGLRRGRLEYALRVELEDEQWIKLQTSVEALGASV